MRSARESLPRPDPGLHNTGSEGIEGNRGLNELRLLEHVGMRPGSHILDVGCGIGRLAYECASYLDDDATYTGLDIEPVVIEWLNANYAPNLPGFRFDLLDVYGELYRPRMRSRWWRWRRRLSPRRSTRRAASVVKTAAPSAVGPEHARFPYEDNSFDVVCAFEVLMHLSMEGTRNYLREIARVLRPGGLAVVTLVAIFPGEDDLSFEGRQYVQIGDGIYTRSPTRPNRSMAYGIDLVRSMLNEAGLDEFELIEGLVHIPQARRPGVAPGVEIPPLSHPCDFFAAHSRKSSAAG